MKKGWQSRCVRENAWGKKFSRWYFIAPSGNLYMFWRGSVWDTIYVPVTAQALSEPDKTKLPENALQRFNRKSDYNAGVREDLRAVHTRALNYLYEVEARGGFKQQKKMNALLASDREFRAMFSQAKTSYSYNSMP